MAYVYVCSCQFPHLAVGVCQGEVVPLQGNITY